MLWPRIHTNAPSTHCKSAVAAAAPPERGTPTSGAGWPATDDCGSDSDEEAPGDIELERGMSSGTERFDDDEKSDELEIGVQGDMGVCVGVV